MNALRTFATPDANGTLTIQVPEEYREQQVEVIILPVTEYSIPRDKYYFENIAKIRTMDKRDVELQNAMNEMARQAAENGMTPDILDNILNDSE